MVGGARSTKLGPEGELITGLCILGLLGVFLGGGNDRSGGVGPNRSLAEDCSYLSLGSIRRAQNNKLSLRLLRVVHEAERESGR